MSSFTKPLTVTKMPNGKWKVSRKFRFYVGGEDSLVYVEVPRGFETDFASVPRIFWTVFPPDGRYSQAAVVHDYMYNQKMFERKECDKIFLEAMEVLGVPFWKRRTMFRAVRAFGWVSWNKKAEEELLH